MDDQLVRRRLRPVSRGLPGASDLSALEESAKTSDLSGPDTGELVKVIKARLSEAPLERSLAMSRRP